MAIPPRRLGALEVRGQHSLLARRVSLPVQQFIRTEVGSGVALLGAAVAALIWANSPWAPSYVALWHTPITVDLAMIRISEDLQHWVNDALMALFFFVVGLEIKRELLHGELSDRRQAALPVAAALGGMAVPALIFVAFNVGGPALRGWAVPVATDIAFALGVLALAGRGLPPGLRVFLLGVAVADDIGGILIIALFYTAQLSLPALGAAVLLTLLIWGLLRLGLQSMVVYIMLGVALWLATYASGIHATIAGVVLGALVPASPTYRLTDLEPIAANLLARFREARERDEAEEADAIVGQLEEVARGSESTLERLEELVHPWSSYAVIPIFALANAGVAVDPAMLGGALSSPVSLGVFLGLVVGKPLGIVAASWIAVRGGLAVLPAGVRWPHVAGAGCLAGIGFTVAIFIANLAFTGEAALEQAKLAILCASLAAGLAGYAGLRTAAASQQRQPA